MEEGKIPQLIELCNAPDTVMRGDLWVSDDHSCAVYTARSAGFCFGVQRALDTVYIRL